MATAHGSASGRLVWASGHWCPLGELPLTSTTDAFHVPHPVQLDKLRCCPESLQDTCLLGLPHLSWLKEGLQGVGFRSWGPRDDLATRSGRTLGRTPPPPRGVLSDLGQSGRRQGGISPRSPPVTGSLAAGPVVPNLPGLDQWLILEEALSPSQEGALGRARPPGSREMAPFKPA